MRKLLNGSAGQLKALHAIPVEADYANKAARLAKALFEAGAEIVYLATDDEGRLLISEEPPDERVVVVARTPIQVRRYADAILRHQR